MGLFGGNYNKYRPDYTTDMLPKNRFELFWEMLKLNLFNLVKANLMYLMFCVPFWINLILHLTIFIRDYSEKPEAFVSDGYLFLFLIFTAVTFLISSPAKAALKYVTRNYSRDDHVWLWSDFFAAIRVNFRQALGMGVLNGIALVLFAVGANFYSNMAGQSGSIVYLIALFMLLMTALVYLMLNIYVWPMMVTYELSFRELLKNSFVLAVGRLPLSIVFGLLQILPAIISVFFLPAMLWYLLIGYSFASFLGCSYTNAAFDRYFNPRIEGAEIGKGMQKPDEDDEEEEKPEKPASAFDLVFGNRKKKKNEVLEDLDPDEDE